MLSQVATLEPKPLPITELFTPITIKVTPDPGTHTVTFDLEAPNPNVSASGNVLTVSPGSYSLQFNLPTDILQFDDPAISVSTPFAPVSVSPDSSTSVTLPDTNNLTSADGSVSYQFSFNISGSVYDPTIVNDPPQ